MQTEASELTTEQAVACALDEGLTLRRAKANGSGTKFWGVKPAGGTQSERWRASIHVGPKNTGLSPSNHDATTHRALGQFTQGAIKGGTIHVGQFASPGGASLAIARRLRDDPRMASHVAGLQVRRCTQGRKRNRDRDATTAMTAGRAGFAGRYGN